MSKISENMTLGQMKQICAEHQKQNKDCETCPLFLFCQWDMNTSYPSGWELEVENVKRN